MMGGVLLEPKEDRVGASLRVQIWALSFGKAWDRRIVGAPGPENRPNGSVSGRKPSSITLAGELGDLC